MLKLNEVGFQILAVVAIATIVILRFEYIKHERDVALEKLAAVEAAAEKQRSEAQQSKKQGLAQTAKLVNDWQANLEAVLKDKQGESSNAKKTIADLRTELADRLRKANRDPIRVPQNGTDSPTSTDSDTTPVGEESVEFYKEAYLGCVSDRADVVKAAKVCTIDYNACYKYVTENQERIGVYAE